jgi:predicted membrane metal-binding protein
MADVGLGYIGFIGLYVHLVAIPANIAVLVALIFQVSVAYGRITEDALSIPGLLAQSGAFTLTGLIWAFELLYLNPNWEEGMYIAAVCFVLVDFLYAAGQLVLFVITRNRLQDLDGTSRRLLEEDEGERDETMA